MGLDIYFHRAKREGRRDIEKKLDEADKKLEACEAELAKKYGENWADNASDEDLSKCHEIHDEISDLCDELRGEEVGYFRKVNFLMSFFGYEGNCEFQEIPLGRVRDLVHACDIVLRDKTSESSELNLPTQSGFFYGDTEYDEWYYENVLQVKEWAEDLLNNFGDEDKFVLLMWCWW